MNSSSSPLNETSLTARPIVFIGMMGSGKTSIGYRLAGLLGLPFYDSDRVIEGAHGISVADYFARHGEPAFREEEKKTIATLLQKPPCVLSLGGGAFLNDETRALIKQCAVSVWLRADTNILLERAQRHGKRPLLMVENPRARMEELLNERTPIYAEADVVVDSDNRPLAITAERVKAALVDFLATLTRSHEMGKV